VIFPPPVGDEIRDLVITAGHDVAFAHGLNLLSASKDGARKGPWVRFTACLEKIDGNWLILHDHVSAPIDPHSGKALLDLQP
jgi:ketosteroid isomerase-like protein